MKMHMIATLYNGDKHVGYRILDSDANKTIDVSDIQVMQVLKQGQSIKNIEIVDEKLKGSNGDISRYAKIVNGTLASGNLAPVVVIAQIGEVGYMISDHNGKIINAKNADVLQYAKRNGIANGKISSRDNQEFISAIFGTYDKIKVPQVQSENIQPKIEEKQSVVTKPEVKTEEIRKPVEKSIVKTLVFNEAQLSVLKEYYEYANISEDEANKEINDLNNKVKTRSKSELYLDTPFIYEVITKLGNNFNIAKAFGSDVGTHMVKFMTVELPFVPSLVKKASEYASSKLYEFYSTLFYELQESVGLILTSEDNTFGVAARIYLEHMVNCVLQGRLKGYDTNEDVENKKFIKEYLLANKFTMNELRAVIGAFDLYKELKGEIPLNRYNISSRKKELYHLAMLYNIEDTDRYGTNDACEKLILLEAIGMDKELFTDESKTYLERRIHTPAKILVKSPLIRFENCKFISTPATKYPNYVISTLDQHTIEDKYTQLIKYLNTDYSLIVSRFCNFITGLYSQIEHDEYKKRQEERNREWEEKQRIERERREKERLEREEAERLRKQREAEEAEKAKQARIKVDLTRKEEKKSIGILGADDLDEYESLVKFIKTIGSSSDIKDSEKVDTYKSLKEKSKLPMTEISFKITDDMLGRGLKYTRMSPKQQYRFNEALDILIREVKGEIKTSAKSSATRAKKTGIPADENKTYLLDEHPEIKDKVNDLVLKADSVEMQAVLQEEPNVLNICYSVLRYKKASDRQLQHIDNAIEILSNQ